MRDSSSEPPSRFPGEPTSSGPDDDLAHQRNSNRHDANVADRGQERWTRQRQERQRRPRPPRCERVSSSCADRRRGGREPGPRRRERRAARRSGSTSMRRRPSSTSIAVGYSLGLAASVLYFGAVGDRYGRKLLLILGMIADDPGRLPRRVGADDRCPVRRPRDRRPRRRHGVPDDAGADHRALVGPGAHEVDRAVVGDRRRDLGARPAAAPGSCSSTSGGDRSS